MKICPACSSQYPDDANFCPMDATRLPDPIAASAAVPPNGAGAASAGLPTLKDGARSVAGRYILGALIAKTATGELHQATDGQTGESVWIKLVEPRALPTAMMADRALREFKQLGKVKSERIARIVDQGRLDDGRVFVVTEVLAGPTLAEVVAREGALSFERARQVVSAIGEALTEAQKVGVIHRDVAPHNVVLLGDKVKLTEFGVAEPVSDRIYGTPAFLSPEQAEGKPVDQRSNIYSLGALFNFLLTGSAPFEGSKDELVQQHLHSLPKPPSQRRQGLTPEVDKLVLKALEKSGGRRHLTLRQLLNEVDALSAPSSLASVAPKPGSADDEIGRARTIMDLGQARASDPVEVGAGALGAATMPSIPAFTEQITAKMRQQSSGAPAVVEPAPVAPRAEPVALEKAAPRVVETPPPVREVAPPVEAVPAKESAKQVAAKESSKKESTRKESVKSAPAREAARPVPQEAPRAAAKESSKSGGPKDQVQRAAQPTVKSAAIQGPPASSAPPAAATGKPGKKGFRETAWFKKGELEEEIAKRSANAEDPLAGPAVIEAHVDEKDLTADDQKRLSLRTGRTEAMPIIKPTAIPGEQMSEEDMLAEVDSSRKWMVIAGIGIALLALAAAVYFLFIHKS